MLVYWVRVMQMVRRTKRDVGRAANFIPPEKLGRVLRAAWIPAVVLWVVLPFVYTWWWTAPRIHQPVFGVAYLDWIALGVAAAAFALTWLCWVRMGKSWRMGIDPNEKTQLVFTGPFAFVRHPIYGLSSVLMLMTMLIVPTPLMFVVGAVHLFLLQWEVRREEVYLVQLHGEQYRAYQRNVGRFFPRSLTPYRPGDAS